MKEQLPQPKKDIIGYSLAKEKKFRSFTSNFCLLIFLIAFIVIGMVSSWWVAVSVFVMILMAQVMLQQNYIFTKRFPEDGPDKVNIDINHSIDGKPLTSKVNKDDRRNQGFRK